MSELDREIYNNWKSAATIPEWCNCVRYVRFLLRQILSPKLVIVVVCW